PCGDEMLGARHRRESLETHGFGARGLAAEVREVVIAAARVVAGAGPAARLFDPSHVQQALHRGVQRARRQLDFAAGALGDILNDGVAVEVFADEGEEDVKDLRAGRWVLGGGHALGDGRWAGARYTAR